MRVLGVSFFPTPKNHSFKQSYLRSEYSRRVRIRQKPIQYSYLVENTEKIGASSAKQYVVVYLKYFCSNNRKLTDYMTSLQRERLECKQRRRSVLGSFVLEDGLQQVAVHIISAYMKISTMVLFKEKLWLSTCFEKHWQNLQNKQFRFLQCLCYDLKGHSF